LKGKIALIAGATVYFRPPEGGDFPVFVFRELRPVHGIP